MTTMECAYCTHAASGMDVDGEPTCGSEETCTVSVGALPSVVEASNEDDEAEAS